MNIKTLSDVVKYLAENSGHVSFNREEITGLQSVRMSIGVDEQKIAMGHSAQEQIELANFDVIGELVVELARRLEFARQGGHDVNS